MPPFILALLGQGLNLLANTAMTKGADFVKEKTGVDITQGQMTSDDLLKLKQFELEHENELIQFQLENNKLDDALISKSLELIESEDTAVSDRWKADTATDSWLAKNVRPISLIYILAAYTVLAIMSAGWQKNLAPTYVDLLGNWGAMILTAYFGGRSLEKIIATVKGAK